MTAKRSKLTRGEEVWRASSVKYEKLYAEAQKELEEAQKEMEEQRKLLQKYKEKCIEKENQIGYLNDLVNSILEVD